MPRLILKHPHTHAGQTHAAGALLEVDADIADWLLAHDIALPEPKPPRVDAEVPLIQRKEPKP